MMSKSRDYLFIDFKNIILLRGGVRQFLRGTLSLKQTLN